MSDFSEIREPGFYGKLPTYGDFIQKRLPNDFTNPWHEWLQQGLVALRETDPDGWRSFYLNCPAWCFVMDGGICGEQGVAGVTIPSVDKVGRYFNFTFAVTLPENTAPALFAGRHAAWFNRLKQLALAALDEEMDQDRIEQALVENAAELNLAGGIPGAFEESEDCVRLVEVQDKPVADRFSGIAHHFLSIRHDRYALWWHGGSSQVSAQLVCCEGLPSTDAYLKLMRNEDLAVAPQAAAAATSMDYIDELIGEERTSPADGGFEAEPAAAQADPGNEALPEPEQARFDEAGPDYETDAQLAEALPDEAPGEVPAEPQADSPRRPDDTAGEPFAFEENFDDDDDILDELFENAVSIDDENLPDN